MERHFFSLRIAGLVIVAGIAVAALDTAVRGFVSVHDPDGLLRSAAVAGSAGERPLRPYARGWFVGRPGGDAAIRMTCRNGVAFEREHVTGGRVTRYTVVPGDCRRDR